MATSAVKVLPSGRLSLKDRLSQLTFAEAPAELVASLRDRLGSCVEEDPSGRPRLSVTLPDRAALDALAQTLARLLVTTQGPSEPPTSGGRA